MLFNLKKWDYDNYVNVKISLKIKMFRMDTTFD